MEKEWGRNISVPTADLEHKVFPVDHRESKNLDPTKSFLCKNYSKLIHGSAFGGLGVVFCL